MHHIHISQDLKGEWLSLKCRCKLNGYTGPSFVHMPLCHSVIEVFVLQAISI